LVGSVADSENITGAITICNTL